MHSLMRAVWYAARFVFRNVPIERSLKAKVRYGLLKHKFLSRLVADTSHPGSLEPSLSAPPKRGNLPDVVIWAIIDWHYTKQRPQHLARNFAQRGHRVFYISGHFIDKESPGFRIECIDETKMLQVIYLHSTSPSIYPQLANPTLREQLLAGLHEFVAWAQVGPVVSLVQHPFWFGFAESLPHETIVYDLMDHLEGFGVSAPDVLQEEERLLKKADLVVVTSKFLEQRARSMNRHVINLRNAGEYQRFAVRPAKIFEDAEKRPIIGYFGEIAEWFDIELVEKLAREQSRALIVLIGRDRIGARQKLSQYSNVVFPGEIAYVSLAFFLHAFRICLVPFKNTPVTIATNPVKVYEYLSAGKAVVSTNLPEIQEFDGLVTIGVSHKDFLEGVRNLMDVATDPIAERARRQFASAHTWESLTAQLWDAIGRSNRKGEAVS